jgi:hypothetical protein
VNSRPDQTLQWRRSAYSENSGACVEVAFSQESVLIRHGANPRGSVLSFSLAEWRAFLLRVRGEFSLPESADARAVGEVAIDVYLDTDEERIAASVFASIDALARALGAEDIAITELRRGSFWRRSKASIQTGLSDTAVQQRLQTLERFIELWQVDPRQADVDQRTSEAFARMINCLENVPRACIRFGSLLIVKYPDVTGHVLLCRQLSQSEIWAFEKYPELQSRPETVLNALALAVSGNSEPGPSDSDRPIKGA